MKLAFISDIHGSNYYLEKVLPLVEAENVDYIVLLGDILYHGARNDLPPDYSPKKVTEKLNVLKNKIICVRGNCDSEVDQMVLEFPIMQDYTTILFNNRRIFATHGHLFSKDNLPPLSKGDIFIQGHLHVPSIDIKDEIVLLNPGSISLPKDNTPHCYGVFENSLFTIKTLDGDVYLAKKI